MNTTRTAKARTDAKVADTKARSAKPGDTPDMGRPACVQYLQAHGIYSGHSRDTVEQLRALVQQHQAAAQADAKRATTAKRGRPAEPAPTSAADASRARAEADGMVPPTKPALADVDRDTLVAKAKAEVAAAKAAKRAGAKVPATPHADELTRRYQNGETAAAAKGTRKARTATPRSYQDPRYADALAERKARPKRGPGTPTTREQLVERIVQLRKANPEADVNEQREIAYYLDRVTLSRKGWAAAWAEADGMLAAKGRKAA